MKNYNINNIIRSLYIAFLGLFGFSMLGQYMVFNVFHLPFALMEIYFIPAIIIKRKAIVATIKRIKRIKIERLILYMLLIFGILFGVITTGQVSFLQAYRSIIYFFICFDYVQKDKLSISIQDVFLSSFFTIIGELIYVIAISSSRIVSSTNCIAIALAILSAYLMGEYIWMFVTIAISFFLVVNTGYRIGIVVVALCMMQVMLFSLFEKDKKLTALRLCKRLLVLFVTLGVGFIVLKNYEAIINYIADLTGMSYFAVFRITQRLKGLIELDFQSSQDTSRFEIFRMGIVRLTQVLPRGLIGELIDEYRFYIDIPIIYLFDLFGSVATIGLLIRFTYSAINEARNYRKYGASDIKKLSLWMIPTMCILFILNGSFLVIVFQTIETGFILGILMNKRHVGTTNG